MKFKKGDKVRVRPDSKFHKGKYANEPGVVAGVDREDDYPYRINFYRFEFSLRFHANELIRVCCHSETTIINDRRYCLDCGEEIKDEKVER